MMICHHDTIAEIGLNLDSAMTRDDQMLCDASRGLIPAT